MSDLQVSQVLAQIRALSQQVRPQVPGATGASGAGGIAGASGVGGIAGASGATGAAGAGPSAFATVLANAVDQVNRSQQKADDLANAFQRGAPGVDLPQVMIESQKATVSFRALTEVRNRLVSAYQDIMNMQM